MRAADTAKLIHDISCPGRAGIGHRKVDNTGIARTADGNLVRQRGGRHYTAVRVLQVQILDHLFQYGTAHEHLLIVLRQLHTGVQVGVSKLIRALPI